MSLLPHVTVADSCHGYNSPPESIWNGPEAGVIHARIRMVYNAGEQYNTWKRKFFYTRGDEKHGTKLSPSLPFFLSFSLVISSRMCTKIQGASNRYGVLYHFRLRPVYLWVIAQHSRPNSHYYHY